MWNRSTRHVINAPSAHTISIGQIAFPHCTLNVATYSGANRSIMQMAKFDGFHRCLPLQRMTYFEVIEMALHNAYGQNSGERMRIPTLIPEMYALAACGHLPVIKRPRTSSTKIAMPMARRVRDQLSRKPNETCPMIKIVVMNIGTR